MGALVNPKSHGPFSFKGSLYFLSIKIQVHYLHFSLDAKTKKYEIIRFVKKKPALYSIHINKQAYMLNQLHTLLKSGALFVEILFLHFK